MGLSIPAIEIQRWAKEIRPNFNADLIAGITLLALIVPEAVAHANLAKAPTPMAGIYGLIIILPIYALLASSRYVVATSTAAVSATMAGFLGAIAGDAKNAFALMVLATAVAYLAFYVLRLGFITSFISEPVSRGFMFGLGAFIIVDQSAKLFGFKTPKGDTILQVVEIAEQMPKANWICFGLGVLCFVIISVSKRISERMPGGLIAMIVMIVIFYFYPASKDWDITMVGALPDGLPKFAIPTIELNDLATIIAAAVGLVILGTSESQLLADNLARDHDQRVDADQQFLAFGASNLVASFFGGHLSTGSTSSTMVDEQAGAKTLMSTIWAAIGALLVAFFLTGVFAYVPDVFLGVLIIHALIHLLNVREILEVRRYSRREFVLAVTAALAVMIFGVLDGLLLTMILNVMFLLASTANVRLGEFRYAKDSGYVHLDKELDQVDLVKPPEHVLIVGATSGLLYYVSARQFLDELDRVVAEHPKADTIVISLSHTNYLDFTATSAMENALTDLVARGKTIYITDVHDAGVIEQLEVVGAISDKIKIVPHLDVSKL